MFFSELPKQKYFMNLFCLIHLLFPMSLLIWWPWTLHVVPGTCISIMCILSCSPEKEPHFDPLGCSHIQTCTVKVKKIKDSEQLWLGNVILFWVIWSTTCWLVDLFSLCTRLTSQTIRTTTAWTLKPAFCAFLWGNQRIALKSNINKWTVQNGTNLPHV